MPCPGAGGSPGTQGVQVPCPCLSSALGCLGKWCKQGRGEGATPGKASLPPSRASPSPAGLDKDRACALSTASWLSLRERRGRTPAGRVKLSPVWASRDRSPEPTCVPESLRGLLGTQRHTFIEQSFGTCTRPRVKNLVVKPIGSWD